MGKSVILCNKMVKMSDNSFSGEFEVTIDTKGRILVPGGLKKQLPDTNTSFVISRGFEKCLTFYTPQSWEMVIKKIKDLNDFDPKVRAFRRQFLGGATQVELDAAGRLLLPQVLREFASLDKNIIIAAALDRFEIWDAATYKKFFDSISADDFSLLAQEVMQKKD